jgi:putative transposase
MATDTVFANINLPEGQRVRWDGRLLTYRGRARNQFRSHVFIEDNGLPVSMTDQQILEEQQDERLCLVTQEELDRANERLPRRALEMASTETLEQVAIRQRYVHAWVSVGRPPRTPAGLTPVVRRVSGEMATAKPPSWRTLARWISNWILCGERPDGLIPGQGGNRTDRIGVGRDLLRDTVERFYLVDSRPTATQVQRHVQVAFEDYNQGLPPEAHLPTPSLQATLNQIREIDSYTIDYSREGARVALHRHRPVTSGPVSERINDAWEIDHTVVDAIVVDEETRLPIGRPWVTIILDRCSRMPMGMRIGFEPPSANTVLECLGMAVLPKDDLLATIPDLTTTWPCFGTPRVLITDQGKEFKSKVFLESCLMLGIDVQHAPVLRAWYKGRVERFFRTLSQGVFQRVPGTTFSNIFQRNDEAIPERVAVTSLVELTQYTVRFLTQIYMRRPHRALGGQSPLAIWNDQVRRHGLRLPPSPSEVSVATAHTVWRKPQRYGIEFEGLIYNSAEVANFRVSQKRTENLRVRVDPYDLTRVTIIDPLDGLPKIIPILPAMRHLVEGVSLKKYRLARALQRQNLERLAGEVGLKRAYRVMDAAMANLSGQDGLRNRAKAAQYWAALTRPSQPEDPPEFDVQGSGRSVLEQTIEAALADIEDDPPRRSAAPEAQESGSHRRRTQHRSGTKAADKQEARTPAKQADDAPESADDLDALISRMDLRMTGLKSDKDS